MIRRNFKPIQKAPEPDKDRRTEQLLNIIEDDSRSLKEIIDAVYLIPWSGK